jgi:hypothetical protein
MCVLNGPYLSGPAVTYVAHRVVASASYHAMLPCPIPRQGDFWRLTAAFFLQAAELLLKKIRRRSIFQVVSTAELTNAPTSSE